MEIRRVLDGSEGGKLKNGVGKTEQDKRQPDTFEAGDAAKSIAQRLAHRIEKHHDRVSAAKSEERIHSRQTGEHEPGEWLTNQSPVPTERPVNKQTAPD